MPPGAGRPARSDLHLWYGGIDNNNIVADVTDAPDQRDVEELGGQFW